MISSSSNYVLQIEIRSDVKPDINSLTSFSEILKMKTNFINCRKHLFLERETILLEINVPQRDIILRGRTLILLHNQCDILK